MNRPKVFISRQLPDSVMNRADEKFDLTVRMRSDPMNSEDLRRCLEDYDGVVPTLGDALQADVFVDPASIRCRILANFGAGYNHIDPEAARRAGVAVTNTPGAVTEATADIALALILMTARRTAEGDRLVRRGEWTGWAPTAMLGAGVFGKTLGVIGMGRIGRAVAKRCHAGFDMKVVFFNRSKVPNPGVEALQLESAAEVVRLADFVVVAVPGGPATHHMIDAELLSKMQPRGILVNISRGDVVDEGALVEALQRKEIAGAGLDVYEHEPAVPDELVGMENVVLLPHLGTSVLEVREDMGMMALDNLTAFFAGETPPNLVN
ncbi:MAG: D-glycerate dehydrogenase [Rhodobacteraceae bacterium]|nr:D-glycerate dehydrogenase [Paracoccaceae bacterium]